MYKRQLVNNQDLTFHRLVVEVGRIKNRNKNPVADKAIQELEDEILKFSPNGGPISAITLCTVTSNLNSRLRSNGLSSRELLYQRDQYNDQQIPISDQEVIIEQHRRRMDNHEYSTNSKTRGRKTATNKPKITIGDLVYLKADGNKYQARDRYMVTATEDEWIRIKKFSGNQLRLNSYKIRRDECYRVPDNLLQPKWVIPKQDESDAVSYTHLTLPTKA